MMMMFEFSTVLHDLEQRVVRAREITTRLNQIGKLAMPIHDEVHTEFEPEHKAEAGELIKELNALSTLPVELAGPIGIVPTTAELSEHNKPW